MPVPHREGAAPGPAEDGTAEVAVAVQRGADEALPVARGSGTSLICPVSRSRSRVPVRLTRSSLMSRPHPGGELHGPGRGEAHARGQVPPPEPGPAENVAHIVDRVAALTGSPGSPLSASTLYPPAVGYLTAAVGWVMTYWFGADRSDDHTIIVGVVGSRGLHPGRQREQGEGLTRDETPASRAVPSGEMLPHASPASLMPVAVQLSPRSSTRYRVHRHGSARPRAKRSGDERWGVHGWSLLAGGRERSGIMSSPRRTCSGST